MVRSRWHRRRRRWPRICVELHWYRKLEHDVLLIPELLSWHENRERISVELRPLPEQAASSWDAMADALRPFVGGASVEWRESHGTLRVVIGRLGLPDRLSWQAHGAPEGRLVIGRRHGGGELVIDSRTTPHVLLAGSTGSGKGGAIRATAAAALHAGWHLVVLDPKEPGEYAWLEHLGVPFVTKLREQVASELIAELARKGCSAAIHVLVAIQRPETAQLGEQGGALRNNLTARLALGSLDADGLRMLGISPRPGPARARRHTRPRHLRRLRQ